MNHVLCALAVVSALGCKQSTGDAPASLTKGEARGGAIRGLATTGESAPGGPAMGQGEGELFRRQSGEPGGPPHVDCGKAIPQGVIDKYLPDAKPEWGEPFDNGEGSVVTSCRLIDH